MNNQFSSQPQPSDPIFHIEVDKIRPNPHQPRRDFDEEALKELAGSIREFGLLHPLIVTKHELTTEFGTSVEYHLISGERRWRASKMIGLERVPAIVRKMPTEQERLEMAIIENIQRENLNPIETARAYAKLQDQFSLTQREIAVRVGKSREVVANAIRLLNLPTAIQESVAKGQINESQARLLLMVSDLRDQQNLFEELIGSNLSVRDLRNRIQMNKEKSPAISLPQDPILQNIEEQLREILGTKVKLQKEGQGGKLTISFYSPEELQGIIDKLAKTQSANNNQTALPELPNPNQEFSNF